MQAQTLARRIDEANAIWESLDSLALDEDVPARSIDLLYEAILGYRIRRSSYMKAVNGVDERTATRNLSRLIELGLLLPIGVTRGRHYIAAGRLLEIRAASRVNRVRVTDPYPWMKAELVKASPDTQ